MSECPFCLTGGIDIEPYEFLCRECRATIAKWKAKAELHDAWVAHEETHFLWMTDNTAQRGCTEKRTKERREANDAAWKKLSEARAKLKEIGDEAHEG